MLRLMCMWKNYDINYNVILGFEYKVWWDVRIWGCGDCVENLEE